MMAKLDALLKKPQWREKYALDLENTAREEISLKGRTSNISSTDIRKALSSGCSFRVKKCLLIGAFAFASEAGYQNTGTTARPEQRPGYF